MRKSKKKKGVMFISYLKEADVVHLLAVLAKFEQSVDVAEERALPALSL